MVDKYILSNGSRVHGWNVASRWLLDNKDGWAEEVGTTNIHTHGDALKRLPPRVEMDNG